MTDHRPRRSPWPYAIVGGLLIVIAVNIVMAVIATRGADPVVSSYSTEPR
jgi:hypothetical protein